MRLVFRKSESLKMYNVPATPHTGPIRHYESRHQVQLSRQVHGLTFLPWGKYFSYPLSRRLHAFQSWCGFVQCKRNA